MIIKCNSCRRNITVNITQDQINHWQSTGMLIQNAMPEASADDREMLISGICNDCFERICKEEEY